MSHLLHMSLHMFAVRFHPHNAVTGISSLSPYVLGSAMAWHWRPPTLQMLNPCGSLQVEKKAFIFFGLRSTACSFQCWHGGKKSHYSKNFFYCIITGVDTLFRGGKRWWNVLCLTVHFLLMRSGKKHQFFFSSMDFVKKKKCIMHTQKKNTFIGNWHYSLISVYLFVYFVLFVCEYE